MKQTQKIHIITSISLLISFLVWTVLVGNVDVKPIGPNASTVGFATLNAAFHKLTGTNMTLYVITDWLGLVPIAVAFGFAVLGLVQWIKRKSILRVDRNILVLGIFYLCTMAIYVLFEYVVINYRPILINGYLEASYPSSTTMLVTCVIPTAIMQLRERIESRVWRRAVVLILASFTIFMVVGRLISGVHWLSDIVGGILVSAGLVCAYRSAT